MHLIYHVVMTSFRLCPSSWPIQSRRQNGGEGPPNTLGIALCVLIKCVYTCACLCVSLSPGVSECQRVWRVPSLGRPHCLLLHSTLRKKKRFFFLRRCIYAEVQMFDSGVVGPMNQRKGFSLSICRFSAWCLPSCLLARPARPASLSAKGRAE